MAAAKTQASDPTEWRQPSTTRRRAAAWFLTLEGQDLRAAYQGGDVLEKGRGRLTEAGLAKVQELLLSTGLGRLCDGEHRAGDHELVKAVAAALQTPQAVRVLRNAVWLQADLKGTGAKPARTIGTVVRCLGEVVESKKVDPRGAQQQLYRWVLPG